MTGKCCLLGTHMAIQSPQGSGKSALAEAWSRVLVGPEHVWIGKIHLHCLAVPPSDHLRPPPQHTTCRNMHHAADLASTLQNVAASLLGTASIL